MCAASLRLLLFQCSSISIILTLSTRIDGFPFSFHIWSAIPDFSISLHTTAFRCSCRRRHVSPLYTLPQLHIRDASWIDRRERLWRHYLNNIFIVLERLVWSTNFKKWFPRLNHSYTHLNKGHLRKAGEYSGRNIVFLTSQNKNKDNSSKNHNQNNI